MTFSRAQIDAIAVGSTLIATGIDGRFGEFTPVIEIFARGDDIHGKLYVCGYRQHGDNGAISFSVKEGDESDFRHIRIKAA